MALLSKARLSLNNKLQTSVNLPLDNTTRTQTVKQASLDLSSAEGTVNSEEGVDSVVNLDLEGIRNKEELMDLHSHNMACRTRWEHPRMVRPTLEKRRNGIICQVIYREVQPHRYAFQSAELSEPYQY